MAQQILSTNTFTASTWIVNSDATKGTHTTLAAALTSASSGDLILLQTSVTENPTLKAGVNITGFPCDSSFNNTGRVKIIGKCTMSTAGTVTLSGIELQTNSDFLLAVTGSAASIVNLNNCYLNCVNNTGISFTTSNAAAVINIYYCVGDLGTTGIGVFSASSTGSLSMCWCQFTNTGSSVTASTSSATAVDIRYSNLPFVFSTSSTGVINLRYNAMGVSASNTTLLTTVGTGGMVIEHCRIASGTASAISVGTGTTVNILYCVITSTNTNAITGAGTLNYYGLSFDGTSRLINTTTQVGGLLQGGVNQAPSTGFVGEQIRSAVASGSAVTISNNTPTNITSISLTAGIWDVSGVFSFLGATTGTGLQGGISTTSATLSGAGDSEFTFPFVSMATQDLTISLPSFRLTLSATTTTYLVGNMLYTVGTGKGYGRISATRVG